MCYPKPGPRCSSHLKKSLSAAQEELAVFDSQPQYGKDALRRELQDKVQDRLIQYHGTPQGQRELIQLIDKADDDGDTALAETYRNAARQGLQDRQVRVQRMQLVYKDKDRYQQPSFEHDLQLHNLRATRSEINHMIAEHAEKEPTEETKREATYLLLRQRMNNRALETMKALKASGLPAEREAEIEGYGVIYTKSDGTTSGYLRRSYEHQDGHFTTYVPIMDATEATGEVTLSTGEKVSSSTIKATDVYYEHVPEDEKSDETRRVVYDVRKYMR